MTFSIDALERWVSSVDGKWIDLDYAPKQHIWQCHDILLSYIVSVFGLAVTDGHAPGTEYTDQVWRQFPNHRPRLATVFTKHTGTSGIRAGDVVFWSSYGDVGNLPHVAVALSSIQPNGTFLAVSQNPGHTKKVWLTTAGILGYLRPKQTESEASPTNLGGLPMYAPFWTGPAVNNTKVNGRIVTDYGIFGVPNMQLMGLLVRRFNASFKTGDAHDQMLDIEATILDNFLGACFQSKLAGVRFDPVKFASAMVDELAKRGKTPVWDESTVLDTELLSEIVEAATTRVVNKFGKSLGEKIASASSSK